MDMLGGVSKELFLSSGLEAFVPSVQVMSTQALDSFSEAKFKVVSNGLMVSCGLGSVVPSSKVSAA